MIHRFEVRAKDPTSDPTARRAANKAIALGIEPSAVHASRIYLLEAKLSESQINTLRTDLFADPVLESCTLGAEPAPADAQTIEVHPLPGVMDPAAQTVRNAVKDLTAIEDLRVSTGWRYDFVGLSKEQAHVVATGALANDTVDAVHAEPFHPDTFPTLAPADQSVVHVTIRGLDDDALMKMSREDHLFLSLDEMRAIRDYYEAAQREPTDIELETLAQTWSEHCVHKTLKSTVRYTAQGEDIIDWTNRPGVDVQQDGSVVIHNLLKSTVAAATHELIAEGIDWTRSVFVDNAGIIDFDEHNAVCVKVETHNHPSAIEPYGGAATGIGGCIRDIMGTGLAAKPIANTDVFCVAMPDTKPQEVPEGCIHPRRTLERVIDGVRDYGNRMGIPTLNGTVYFDNRYIGNPLVYCGCIGVMPNDKTHGDAQPGDLIVALGGRTGKDGIHGATFSSAELTDTHADEFSHAVQIGNAIEEKRTLDAILRARDHESGCLYSAITDCGAGGFSSAVGEMGEKVGAIVHLDKAPLKYEGLRYDEIWISESQERMVLAVPEANLTALQAICDQEHVELAALGTFGHTDNNANPELLLHYAGNEVGRMPMALLHDAIPMPTRDANWSPPSVEIKQAGDIDIKQALLDLLAHPNIASKRWIVRQYDHEVQGNTIIKPLVGPGGIGPGDAAVIQPVPGSRRGLAIGCGLQTQLGDPDNGGDPYLMALAAVDECVRNLVCVGADPERIAILDNFCWPSCNDPKNMASLVRACMGCYDAAKAYRTPFVSGKDSLNNQFRTKDGRLIEIPPTLLITGIGIVPDVSKCVTMDLKPEKESGLLVIGDDRYLHEIRTPIGALEPDWNAQEKFDSYMPLGECVKNARAVAELIREGKILAAHDVSEGGVLTAMAEMLIASSGTPSIYASYGMQMGYRFGEGPGCYVLQVAENESDYVQDFLRKSRVSYDIGGQVHFDNSMSVLEYELPDEPEHETVTIYELRDAFLGTLNW